MSPSSATGNNPGGGPVTTNSVTVSVVPAGAYTYLWTKVGGGDITVQSPSSATTAFQGFPNDGEVISANFRCAVSNGAVTIDSPNVGVAVDGF